MRCGFPLMMRMPGGGCGGGYPRCFVLGVHWWAYGGRGGLQHGDIWCGPFWSSLFPLVGAGCGGFIGGLSRCGRRGRCMRRGGGARAACVLFPGAGRRPGPLWGTFSAFIL